VTGEEVDSPQLKVEREEKRREEKRRREEPRHGI